MVQQIKYKPKPKKCKHCGTEFMPYNPLQFLCSPSCALEYNSEKEVNKRYKELKTKVKKETEKSKLLKKLVFEFHTYIKLRDKDEPCISCGRTKVNEWAAGHFWAAGNYSFLRFNEDNVHKQCNDYCNKHLHGNLSEYRINLVKKIGAERVKWLDEHRHDKLELTIPEIKILIEKYKKLCRFS